MDDKPFLLLTAAIDARNGSGCLFSKEEREKQYLHAFRWYIRFLRRNEDLCAGILFCENSEADLSAFRAIVPNELRNKVEFLSLPMDGFRPEKGKSYNEMRTIDLSLEKSSLLGPQDVFVKITGRYPVRNLRGLLSDLKKMPAVSVCYFRMRFGGRHPDLADTRCIAFRKTTWTDFFAGLYETADDATDHHFEHIVLEVLEHHAGDEGWSEGFSRPPLILGKQGHIKRIGRHPVPKSVEWVYMMAQYLYQRLMSRRYRHTLSREELPSDSHGDIRNDENKPS